MNLIVLRIYTFGLKLFRTLFADLMDLQSMVYH